MAIRNTGRYLHQQGRARNEGARRAYYRRGGGGHALAWHISFRRGENASSPCRTGGIAKQFHDPCYGRSAPAAEATHYGRGGSEERSYGKEGGRKCQYKWWRAYY